MTTWVPQERNKEKEKTLSKSGVAPILSRVISQRPIAVDDAPKFLEAKYADLSDPFDLHDMKKAVQILAKHQKSNVFVVGDYDADGIMSSVMMKDVLEEIGMNCKVILPNRFVHGYGLNTNTIESIKEEFDKQGYVPELLITVDCGTSNKEETKQLKQMGVQDIIVIDHHLPDYDNLSDASAMVSWHFNDSDVFSETCAAGEVFHLIRALQKSGCKNISPADHITHATLGIIADSSPIIGNNRIIVRHGLSSQAILHSSCGFSALKNVCKIKTPEISQEDVAFRIAPRINAAGRMSSPDLAFRLFTASDYSVAESIAKEVDDINKERKAQQNQMEKEALELAKQKDFEKGIVLMNADWHVGIVGIVASKISEHYNMPCLIAGKYNDTWKGSGRTIPDMPLKSIMNICSDMFEKYGGHEFAAGFTIKNDKINDIERAFDQACKKYCEEHEINIRDVKEYCASLSDKAISRNIAKEVLKLSPYCPQHNEEPVFKLSNVTLINIDIKQGNWGRMAIFQVQKNNQTLSPKMKMFSPNFDGDHEGDKADLYFTFPQSWNDEEKFCEFQIPVIDVVF